MNMLTTGASSGMGDEAACAKRGQVACAKSLPFSVNKNLAVNLSDQLADGLRGAILSGYYKKGEMLPKLSDMASALGVSMRIPREAVAKLASENLVSPRQRLGCVVLGRREAYWRGQVLAIVPVACEGAYFAMMLLGEMRRRLVRAGYLFSVFTLDREANGRWNFTGLDLMLKQKQTFAVPLYCPKQVFDRLDRFGTPWSTILYSEDFLPHGSAGYLGDMAEFLGQCAAKSVRRVLLVGYDCRAAYDGIGSTLKDAGLEVEESFFSKAQCGGYSYGYLERIQRLGMNAALKRFSAPRETWPDLVLWLDDFLAIGGLMALQELGVRAPDDVFAVTLANKGFVPVYPRSLARFEFDPVATGEKAAEAILDHMAGKPTELFGFIQQYIPGDTFPAG